MKNLFITIAMVMFFGSAIAQETPKQTKSTQDTVKEHLAKKRSAAEAKKANKEQKANEAKMTSDLTHPATKDTISTLNTKRKTKK
ncbi:hypothetical protein IRZ71_04150 [Flavobacterium sp. ANB]|uniref:hypothetical protein n=1 Tax=unclassified Flavobacterium TaxID=196869 RepID=UPI0012B9A7D8|nr:MULTISPECIES: hypothetical protein [unclassified Flavobacterium]MBF4515517.1 hypothetical protein [Flavobacterium sp. ANB]MTD68520.1 hypothetical protein [Flavobacterium sp. LC2016-13]